MIKKLIISLLTVICVSNLFSQDTNNLIQARIDTVDLENFNLYIYPRINIPRECIVSMNKRSIPISFKIHSDGTIGSIQIADTLQLNYADKEIERVLLESSGEWKPSVKNGKKVATNVSYSLSLYADKKLTRKVKRNLKRSNKAQQKNRIEKAIAKRHKILVYIPNDRETLIDLAKLYVINGQLREACKLIEDCGLHECINFKGVNCK